jgi:hypothetical protein
MKRQTKQTLGAGLLLGSVILGVFLYKRSRQPGLSTDGVTRVLGAITEKELRRGRRIRQMMALKGETPKVRDNRVERVLPNGMTQKFARKYRQMLLDRKKQPKVRYYSSEGMGLPHDKVVA